MKLRIFLLSVLLFLISLSQVNGQEDPQKPADGLKLGVGVNFQHLIHAYGNSDLIASGLQQTGGYETFQGLGFSLPISYRVKLIVIEYSPVIRYDHYRYIDIRNQTSNGPEEKQIYFDHHVTVWRFFRNHPNSALGLGFSLINQGKEMTDALITRTTNTTTFETRDYKLEFYGYHLAYHQQILQGRFALQGRVIFTPAGSIEFDPGTLRAFIGRISFIYYPNLFEQSKR